MKSLSSYPAAHKLIGWSIMSFHNLINIKGAGDLNYACMYVCFVCIKNSWKVTSYHVSNLNFASGWVIVQLKNKKCNSKKRLKSYFLGYCLCQNLQRVEIKSYCYFACSNFQRKLSKLMYYLI